MVITTNSSTNVNPLVRSVFRVGRRGVANFDFIGDGKLGWGIGFRNFPQVEEMKFSCCRQYLIRGNSALIQSLHFSERTICVMAAARVKRVSAVVELLLAAYHPSLFGGYRH